MKFSRQEIDDMQEYLKTKLKMLSINHSYPSEEKILTKLLIAVTELEFYD